MLLPMRSTASRLLAAFFLILGASASLPAQEDNRTLRVFIFAGQSNMVGSDSRAQDIEKFPPFAGLEKPQDDVKFSYCIGREDKRQSKGWVELQPVDDVVGPELSFARRVAENVKAPIAIIKIAAGGTELATDWNPDQPSGFELYPLALHWIRAALADLERKKIAYRLEGFFWHQGENDMFHEGHRASYGSNLKHFIGSWRRDLAAPDLRFYVGELCTKTIWGMDNRAPMYAISLGQREVTDADPLAEYVPTSHVAIEIGGGAGLHYHYGTLGQLEHGVNYADAYLRSVGREPKLARPLAPWPYEPGSAVSLFVLAGHRNMEGERAFVQDLKQVKGKQALRKDNPKIAFRYVLGGGYKVSDDWEPLGPAGFYDTFGPATRAGQRCPSSRRLGAQAPRQRRHRQIHPQRLANPGLDAGGQRGEVAQPVSAVHRLRARIADCDRIPRPPGRTRRDLLSPRRERRVLCAVPASGDRATRHDRSTEPRGSRPARAPVVREPAAADR